MRAFIYTRSAEPNPEQQRRQYEQCKTLAEEHQYEVVGIAHDDGYERSGLATLIEGLRAHDIDIVLTSDHACLSPTLTALAAMVDEIHLSSVCSASDMSSPVGELKNLFETSFGDI